MLLKERDPFRNLTIGARLSFSFAITIALMAAGAATALLQFSLIQGRVERLYQVDQKSVAVLRIHSDLLMMRDRLEESLAAQDARRFAAEARPLTRTLLEGVERARQALAIPSSNARDSSVWLATLEMIRGALPSQVSELTSLTESDDWAAARLRLENQLKQLSSVAASLAEEVSRDVAEERRQTLEDIHGAHERGFLLLLITAVITLLIAGALGLAVTRGITRPLMRLRAAANALANGDFQHEIAVSGRNELADLGRAFADSGRRLDGLYGALRSELNERMRAENEIKLLSERLINAQEDERRRIARELHDDLSQEIAALSLSVTKLKRDVPENERGLRARTEQLHQRIVKLAEAARHLSHQLHPAVLEHSGVTAALRSYCAEFASLSGVEVTVEADGRFADLPSAVALCIYRVAQEALQNVARHSGEKSARVELKRSNGSVWFAVSDSGRGFQSGLSGGRSGLGLVSMKERTRLVHGTFQVESAPNRGTSLRVSIPIGVPNEGGKPGTSEIFSPMVSAKSECHESGEGLI